MFFLARTSTFDVLQKLRSEKLDDSCGEILFRGYGARSAETPGEGPSVCRENSLSLPGAPLPHPFASPRTHPRPWLTALFCFQAEVGESVVAVAGSQVLTLCASTSSEPRQSKQTCMCILVTDIPQALEIYIYTLCTL